MAGTADVSTERGWSERGVGERWVPGVGALLIFLAAVTFLALGIQRGWVTPLLQILIAAAFGAGLLLTAEVVRRRVGFGALAQSLVAAGCCVLYATAFASYAFERYRDALGTTELTSGILMAVVAAGTVWLALRRDARLIVGLGFVLAFLTAALGLTTMPRLTVPYVTILGGALAAVVAFRGWWIEALVGAALTFTLLYALASSADAPTAWGAAFASLAPAAAYAVLTLRQGPVADARLAPVLATVVVVGALAASSAPVVGRALSSGLLLFGWCVALSCAAYIAHSRANTVVAAVYGVAAILAYVVWPYRLGTGLGYAESVVVLSYGVGSLVLLALARAGSAFRFASAGLALLSTGLALLYQAPALAATTWPIAAASTYVVVGGALVGNLLRPTNADGLSAAVAAAVVLFFAAWPFELTNAGYLWTILAVLGAGTLLVTSARPGSAASAAAVAGLAVLGLAALRVAVYDLTVGAREDAPLAALGSAAALVAALLVTRRSVSRTAVIPAGLVDAGLVGAAATVTASSLLAHTPAAWASPTLAVAALAFVTAGFVRRDLPARFAGLGLLAVVVVRVMFFDLRGTDLAVRAVVLALLGAMLLGVGYAYARWGRRLSTTGPST